MREKIKKRSIAVIIILLAQALSVQAQLENITLSKNTIINKAYFGFRSDVKAFVDSTKVPVVANGNVRFGFLVTQKLNNHFSVECQAVLQHSNANSTISLPAFELMYNLTSALQIRAGYLVTPTTTTRPNPVTWQSQVETYAQSRAIGSKPGAMLRYTVSPNLFLVGSLHYQNNHWAPHFRADFKTHRLAGYYENDSTYFISLKSIYKKFESNFNFNKVNDEFATSVFYNLNSQFSLYTDINRKFKKNQSDVLTLGIRSYFRGDKLRAGGFLAVFYDFKQRYIAGQFFIHLAELKQK